jgi:flagellar motor switch protein FliM
MQTGDIITLDTKVNDHLKVTVKDKVKFFSQPGILGKRKAAKITKVVEQSEEKLYE